MRGPSQARGGRKRVLFLCWMHYAGGNGLTICGFFSHQWLSFSKAIGGIDRNLVARLWCQPLKHGGGDITRHCFFPSLIREQGFPGDPIMANLSRCCCPEDSKAGLGDILRDQVFRRAKDWEPAGKRSRQKY